MGLGCPPTATALWFLNEGCHKNTYFQEIILHLVSTCKEQPAWVPKFTELGFKKTRIPPDVYAMLLWDYERQKPSMIDESNTRGEINSEHILNIKKKAQSTVKDMGRAFLTNLRLSLMM